MNYGLPYMGSKKAIAEGIVDYLPAGDVLVDLFAGGCAITHAALLSGKWRKVIANDIGPAPELFRDAASGKYANERRWVSRDEFFLFRDSDHYVKYCWSYGNNGDDYLYCREIEEYKHHLHNVYFAETLEECKQAVRKLLRYIGKGTNKMAYYPEKLENLERLQRLQSLKCLKCLKSFEVSRQDYAEVEIPAGAVVYCDPPHRTESMSKKKSGYMTGFDFDRFNHWAATREFPVYCSEYSMPEPPFAEILALPGKCKYASGHQSRTEKLYIQERFLNAERKQRAGIITPLFETEVKK